MNTVGIGYDVHRFIEHRPLVLGGVEIPYTLGLQGHSDADVLCHAIADAILGAAGKPDIGHFFPNTDKSFQCISSLKILRRVYEILDTIDAVIINVDATIIAEEPKIAPHLADMKLALSGALALTTDRIGIKATTNEGLGFLGRGEGIAAFAVAIVDRK